jgi:integrase/recombinase XerD
LNDHPDKRPEAPLWIHSKQGCHENGIVPLDYYSARKLLTRLRTKAGVAKAVNPQAFRHARATQLANYLTEAQLKEFFGWSRDSKMAGRYVHLSGRDVDNALLRAHGLQAKREEEKPKLNVAKCARCDFNNSTVNSFCSKCGMTLTAQAGFESENLLTRIEKLETKNQKLEFEMQMLQDASSFKVGASRVVPID